MKVTQSALFLKQLLLLNKWLEVNWGMTVAAEFQLKLDKAIRLIAAQPGTGRASAHGVNIRSKLITKHNRLYYRVKSDGSVVLLTLFDARQNPRKNKYE